jgi:hypothetical protein
MTPQTPVNPRPDPEVMERAADELQKLLGVLLVKAQEVVTAFAGRGLREDVEELLRPFQPRDRGIVLSALVIETQRRFDEAGSAKVGISGGCAGAEGAGVMATEGNITVKACVTGSLDEGMTGGGFEISGRKW